MAQKAPILLYQEAQATLVNTINHFIQKGVPVYELKQIMDMLSIDLNKLVEQEIKKAQEEYQNTLKQEENEELKAE